MSEIILVNMDDEPIGATEKLKAHKEGLLHRAFSLFVYRKNHSNKVEILLQQRHPGKYHSGGLWTNTCCSHPAPNEILEDAIIRRMKEELGISLSKNQLIKAGVFHYTANVGNNLIENEIDHVYIANLSYNETESKSFQHHFDPDEITQITWISLESLKKALHNHPEKYTAWLSEALNIAENYF